MGPAIFGGMGSFADSFAKSYRTETDRAAAEEERKAEREWRQEQQGRQRQEWDEQDRIKNGLRMADETVAVETPNDVLKDDDGNDMPAVPAFRVGTKRYVTMPEALAAAEAQNTPEAIHARMSKVYRDNGKPMDAIQMNSAMLEQQAKQLNLNKAQAEWGNMEFDRLLKEKVPMGPGFGHAFAKMLSETNVNSLAGVKFEAVYAPDGKSFEVVGTGADGTKHVKGTYTDDDAGWAQAMQRANSAELKTKIAYVAEAGKTKRENEEIEIKRRLATAAEKRANALEISALGGGGGGGRGGGRGGNGGEGAGAQSPGALPDPMGGFDSKKAYSLAGELAVKELGEPGAGKAPATPQAIAKRTTALYREMENEFRNTGVNRLATQAFTQSARKAQTPGDVQSLYQDALAAGMTPEQMAAIDPRFAQVAQATQGKTGSETRGQQPNGKTAATTQRSAPAAPAPPLPSMAEIQAQTRQNRARIVQQAEAAKAADRDPAVLQLVQQRKEALRAGKPMLANAISAQINQVKAERYGVK